MLPKKECLVRSFLKKKGKSNYEKNTRKSNFEKINTV